MHTSPAWARARARAQPRRQIEKPTPAANDTARKLEPYLVSIDNMLKGLGPYLAQRNELAPYLAQANRILERLEQRLARVVSPLPHPRAVPTPITIAKQGTIIRYLVRKSDSTYRESGAQPTPQSTPPRVALGPVGSETPPSEVATPRGQSPEMVDWRGALDGCQVDWGAASETDESSTRPTENEQTSDTSVTDDADRYRESRAQPTPLGETPDANGPDAQLRGASPPHGDQPERFDWRVDLRDSTYKYDRLVEPVGPAEQRVGRDTPFITTATLNLQPIRLLRCWSDETLGSRGGHDKESQAPRESTPWRGQTDSPVSHHNSWDRAEVRPQCDTPVSVYDGGG